MVTGYYGAVLYKEDLKFKVNLGKMMVCISTGHVRGKTCKDCSDFKSIIFETKNKLTKLNENQKFYINEGTFSKWRENIINYW